MKNYQPNFITIVMEGAQNVGKSSIASRFAENRFQNQYCPTIGVERLETSLIVDGVKLKLQILSTTGQEFQPEIKITQHSEKDILFFVFDITNKESFAFIRNRIQKLVQIKCSRNYKTVLVGNKCDQSEFREVSQQQANQIAQFIGSYIEVSALTSENLLNLFTNAVANSLKHQNQQLTGFGVEQFMADLKQEKEERSLNFSQYLEKMESLSPRDSSVQDQSQEKQNQLESVSIKLMVVGDVKVGKTTMIHYFCKDEFREIYHSTLGLDYYFYSTSQEGKNYNLQIWDSSGQQRYKTIVANYFACSKSVFVCYDKTNLKSFESCRGYIKALKESLGKIYICLVGIKKINPQMVSVKTAMQLAVQEKIDFAQINVFSHQQLHKLFHKVIHYMHLNNQSVT